MSDQQSTIDALEQQLADSLLERARLEAQNRELRIANAELEVLAQTGEACNASLRQALDTVGAERDHSRQQCEQLREALKWELSFWKGLQLCAGLVDRNSSCDVHINKLSEALGEEER